MEGCFTKELPYLFYSISLEEIVGQLDFSLWLLKQELAGSCGELEGMQMEVRTSRRLTHESPQNHVSEIRLSIRSSHGNIKE